MATAKATIPWCRSPIRTLLPICHGILLLSEPDAAALLAANPTVHLLTMGTKVVPPPAHDVILNEEDKKLQQLFIEGKIHITTRAELAAQHPELHLDQLPPINDTPGAVRASTPKPTSLPAPPSPSSTVLKWLLLAAATLAAFALGRRLLRRK